MGRSSPQWHQSVHLECILPSWEEHGDVGSDQMDLLSRWTKEKVLCKEADVGEWEEEIGSSGPTLSQDASEKCPFMPLY